MEIVGTPKLRSIERRLGRPLRVLHIGNIANNAYNNARIQRRYGVDANVLCYDYYHVMATPEWEDGNLTSHVDPFFPDWWQTNLRGPRRPPWYVQGPVALCVSYLDAKFKRQQFRLKLKKLQLEVAYWNLLSEKATLDGRERRIRRPFAHWLVGFDFFTSLSDKLTSAAQSLRYLGRAIYVAAVQTPPRIAASNLFLLLWRFQRRIRGLSYDVLPPNESDPNPNRVYLWRIALRVLSLSLNAFTITFLHLLLWPVIRLANMPTTQLSTAERELIADELIKGFKGSEVAANEIVWIELRDWLVNVALLFSPILKNYDVIQGYSIDGLIALANGHHNFVAYEHGTIRDIPFQDDLLGLMCRITYRNAPLIFVTNSDVLDSADRIGLNRSSIRCLPHAFDEKKLFKFRRENEDIQPNNAVVSFFSPSRQHWKFGEASWRKGNDAIIMGAAIARQKSKRPFILTLVEWGKEVSLSKDLISNLGIQDLVTWIPPMGKRELWAQYCSSHAVLDQFVLPALGGVGFETLALGRRLITRIEPSDLEAFFGEVPPVLIASSPQEVALAMLEIIDDPSDENKVGEAGRQWIEDYHSSERILNIQIDAYDQLLSGRCKKVDSTR